MQAADRFANRGGARSLVFALAFAGLSASLAVASAAWGQDEGFEQVRQLSSEARKDRRQASKKLIAAGDETLIPALVDALFFTPRNFRAETVKTLEALSGESFGPDYFAWVEYVGGRTDLESRDGYMQWKLDRLMKIDPEFRKIFYKGAPSKIRLEEIVSGGVRLDGIPSLDNPEFVPASEGKFMRDKERVFGVSVGGEHRAYPVRVLSWHEMLNDVIEGEPVTLSYCTLCGSGIAYATQTPSGKPYTFGTSGLLYRSNKLMYDRQSYTLWSNLTGEPVVGRKATTSVKLEVLPTTLTTWEAWLERHPESTVMVPDKRLGARWGFDYTPGAADRRRAGVQFPVWQKSDLLDRNAEIYALRVEGATKAYPIDAVLEADLFHDSLGGKELVVLGDAEGEAVRIFESGGLTFRRGEGQRELIDGTGRSWRVTEEALQSEGAEPLPRVPGHVAFWFGWYGFYPQTEVWTPVAAGS